MAIYIYHVEKMSKQETKPTCAEYVMHTQSYHKKQAIVKLMHQTVTQHGIAYTRANKFAYPFHNLLWIRQR